SLNAGAPTLSTAFPLLSASEPPPRFTSTLIKGTDDEAAALLPPPPKSRSSFADAVALKFRFSPIRGRNVVGGRVESEKITGGVAAGEGEGESSEEDEDEERSGVQLSDQLVSTSGVLELESDDAQESEPRIPSGAKETAASGDIDIERTRIKGKNDAQAVNMLDRNCGMDSEGSERDGKEGSDREARGDGKCASWMRERIVRRMTNRCTRSKNTGF
ncbi:hypothetical protein R3P38DRAFT_3077476, partial [Favolaschia claudopus]